MIESYKKKYKKKRKKTLLLREKKTVLSQEIHKIKGRIPVVLVSFFFFTVCTIYVSINKMYLFFGNTVNFIQYGLLLFVLISLLYLYIVFSIMYNKKQELRNISATLYRLTKLKKNSSNEQKKS